MSGRRRRWAAPLAAVLLLLVLAEADAGRRLGDAAALVGRAYAAAFLDAAALRILCR